MQFHRMRGGAADVNRPVRIRPVEQVVCCFPRELPQGGVGIRHARIETISVHRRAADHLGQRPVSVRAVAVRVVLPERGAVGVRSILPRETTFRVVFVMVACAVIIRLSRFPVKQVTPSSCSILIAKQHTAPFFRAMCCLIWIIASCCNMLPVHYFPLTMPEFHP